MWCNDLRKAYKKILKGETAGIKLTEENIRQLDAGFEWILCTKFDELFAELINCMCRLQSLKVSGLE